MRSLFLHSFNQLDTALFHRDGCLKHAVSVPAQVDQEAMLAVRYLGHVPARQSPDRPAESAISIRTSQHIWREQQGSTVAARPQVPFNIVTRLPSFEEIMKHLPLMDDVPKAEKAGFQVFLNRRNQRRVRFERRRADGEDAEASASEAEEPSICEKFEELTELQQGQLRAQGLYANDLKDILDGRASSFAIVPRQVVVLPDDTEFVLPS